MHPDIVKLETIVKPICQKCGVGLYDIEIINTQHNLILCVYITKVDKISISDCAAVSRELNTALDTVENLFPGPYTLEVSSPGIERSLRFKKHYSSAINEKVKITATVEGKKMVFLGKLLEVDVDFILLEIENEKKRIDFNTIKKAKTVL
jgi:ribosome maturation factor RimP